MNVEFGRRLRELRASTGLTQEAFARLGGVKRFSQSLYEQSVRLPGLDYLENLHAAGIDVTSLLTHLIRKTDELIPLHVAIRAIEAVERSYPGGDVDAGRITDRVARFKLLVRFAESALTTVDSVPSSGRRSASS